MMETIRIGLIDDHKIVRDGLKTLLTKSNDLQVSGEAGDGKEAFSMLKNECPDILIMDISLPDISGIELTRQILHLYPHVKILILSMYTEEDFVINALQAGASGYLPKNTSLAMLQEAVRKIHAGGNYFEAGISQTLLNGLVRKAKSDTAHPETILSKREIEILALCVKGKTNKEIADLFFISIRTVESHKNHIMQKLGLKSTVELLKYAMKFHIGD